jgi:hypothetical protein
MESSEIRANISSIIFSLYMINPQRSSNESVLAGILGLYTGLVRFSDRLLMAVLYRIDLERSINILSSPETWNAFRNNWSRSHVKSISSSLESPFTLIDSDAMQQAILDFYVDVGNTEVQIPIEHSKTSVLEMHNSCDTFDPLFWLPIIVYSLEKTSHSSEMTMMIENSSIGYALVCLSAKQESIRKMAAYLLVKWQHLCEVCNNFGTLVKI